MVLGGPAADEEGLADVGVGGTLSDQPQYLDLPGTEGRGGGAGIGLPGPARETGPGAGPEGLDALGVEPVVTG